MPTAVANKLASCLRSSTVYMLLKLLNISKTNLLTCHCTASHAPPWRAGSSNQQVDLESTTTMVLLHFVPPGYISSLWLWPLEWQEDKALATIQAHKSPGLRSYFQCIFRSGHPAAAHAVLPMVQSDSAHIMEHATLPNDASPNVSCSAGPLSQTSSQQVAHPCKVDSWVLVLDVTLQRQQDIIVCSPHSRGRHQQHAVSSGEHCAAIAQLAHGPHCIRRMGWCIVTSSSAAVGCKPTVLLKWALVAPALRAIATPCMISGASGPTICTPITCAQSQHNLTKGLMPAAA